jgi:ornithine decarboxylase
MSRTLDANIYPSDKSYQTLQSSKLPEPFQILPSTCTDLRSTVLHQIHHLVQKQKTRCLTTQEEDALDDGFMLCDLRTVQRKLKAWHLMFPRIKPFFALKCNPDPMVAGVLGLDRNSGFDCASIAEIKLALKVTDNDCRRAVYANPQRAISDLDQSLFLGIGALTFDGKEELTKVHDAYKRLVRNFRKDQDILDNEESTLQEPLPPQMILRLVVPDRHSSVPLGEKFGAPPDRVEDLVEYALELGLDVIGCSFHCGSGCHDPDAYYSAIKIAKEAIDAINSVIDRKNHTDGGNRSECTVLDIGGGYPGLDGSGGDDHRFSATENKFDCGVINPHADDYEDETAYKIAKVVSPLVDELFGNDTPIQIISEPGRYFVEAAFAFCARIYSVKVEEIDGMERRTYFIAQGVQGLFKDVLLCNETFIPIPLIVEEDELEQGVITVKNTDSSEHFLSTVHGPSGNFDVVARDCMLPKLKVGDFLIFDRMGAYTLSIGKRDSSLPIRYVLGGHR